MRLTCLLKSGDKVEVEASPIRFKLKGQDVELALHCYDDATWVVSHPPTGSRVLVVGKVADSEALREAKAALTDLIARVGADLFLQRLGIQA